MITLFDGKVILIRTIKKNGESMSYKYLFIRQELYDKNFLGKIYPSRSLADIGKLYSRKYWILVVAYFISIGLFVTSFALQYELLKWVFMLILMILAITIDIPREKFVYNEPALSVEKTEIKNNYKQAIELIVELLKDNGIDSLEKLMKLKSECEGILKTHNEKFSKFDSKIIELLLVAPISALVASQIYPQSDVVLSGIILVSLVGISILVLMKATRLIYYYSKGCFKDKFILEIIMDVEYSDLLE